MMQEAAGGDETALHTRDDLRGADLRRADLRLAAAAIIRNGNGIEDDSPLSEQEKDYAGALMKPAQERQTKRHRSR